MNPILLLHGALGAKSQLDAIKAKLQEQGRTVFSMNFSGHGGEPVSPEGFGIEVFADDVIKFLNENGITKADIFGYSMGGYVAIWFAYLQPERVGEVITLGTKFDWSPESAEKEVQKLNPEKILSKVPAFARILEHRHAPNDWKELLAKTSTMMLSLGQTPLLDEPVLSKIKTPTKIYLGDTDDMADREFSKHVSKLLPNGSFVLLHDTGHAIEKTKFVPFLE